MRQTLAYVCRKTAWAQLAWARGLMGPGILSWVVTWFTVGLFLIGAPPPAILRLNTLQLYNQYGPLTKAGGLIAAISLFIYFGCRRQERRLTPPSSPVRSFQISLQFLLFVIAVAIIVLELFRQRQHVQVPALSYCLANFLLFLKLVRNLPASGNIAWRRAGLTMIVMCGAVLMYFQYCGTMIAIRSPEVDQTHVDVRRSLWFIAAIFPFALAGAALGSMIRSADFSADKSGDKFMSPPI
jgi:hypothetical protein